MGFSYVVLGAGRQGLALSYDLARCCEAARITLVEAQPEVAEAAASRLRHLLPDAPCQFATVTADVSSAASVVAHLRGAAVVLSAVPYRFNVALTDAAIAAGASFCDLGGNTAVVQQQLVRHDQAAAAGVSILPDCGLAPGLGNILAAHALATMSDVRHIHVRCGGLPECPVGPLQYKLTFHFDGLINEYSGSGECIRGGQRARVPALTEVEEIEFPPPLGRCEAAVTSGGTSTCGDSFLGRVMTYDYKTVRYPGHFAVMRALFGLGCFEESVVLADGAVLQPKPLMRRLIERHLAWPDVRDLVVLRCTAMGRSVTRQYDLFERHDERTGLTAMERTTAFPAALVAYMQARKLVPPGARPLEQVLPVVQYLRELPDHGIQVAVAEKSSPRTGPGFAD